MYSIPPDDGLKICPKYVEVDWRNKLRINSASSWFGLYYTDAACKIDSLTETFVGAENSSTVLASALHEGEQSALPWGRSPRCVLDKTVEAPKSFWTLRREKSLLTAGNRIPHRFSGSTTRSLLALLTQS